MFNNIGIWGFGIVGKSVLEFLHQSRLPNLQSDIAVWDERILLQEEHEFLKRFGGQHYNEKHMDIEDFFAQHDAIVVSPGVDRRQFSQFRQKFIGELDLFATAFHQPTIAVTGTLGKTTVTKLLRELAAALPLKGLSKKFLVATQKLVVAAGNVGNGMLSLVDIQDRINIVILELSSFQLDLNRRFRPSIALWTNFYPNHLDRHTTLEDYFAAKWRIFSRQQACDVALVSKDVFMHDFFQSRRGTLPSQIALLATKPLTQDELLVVAAWGGVVFYLEDNILWLSFPSYEGKYNRIRIGSLAHAPDITFQENWLMVLATLHLLGKDLSLLEAADWFEVVRSMGGCLSSVPHRLEWCGSFRDIDFYNDSKATVMQATVAAVEKLAACGRPLILILGGISKGVERGVLADTLHKKSHVKRVVFFGQEQEKFHVDSCYPTLEEAIASVMKQAAPFDQVLFSPGGASFDLFQNYQQRGDAFKLLVREYAAAGSS